jgi:hypothetical protein
MSANKIYKYHRMWLNRFQFSLDLEKPLDYFDIDNKKLDILINLNLIERNKNFGSEWAMYILTDLGKYELNRYRAQTTQSTN